MAARSNLARVEPPGIRPARPATAPLIGALGGALTGLATGNPIGAVVGCGVRLLSLHQPSEIRP